MVYLETPQKAAVKLYESVPIHLQSASPHKMKNRSAARHSSRLVPPGALGLDFQTWEITDPKTLAQLPQFAGEVFSFQCEICEVSTTCARILWPKAALSGDVAGAQAGVDWVDRCSVFAR